MLALWACRVENGFSNKPDVNTGEDSADSVPPETDSTPVLDEGCPEQSWDPEYIGIDESCQSAPGGRHLHARRRVAQQHHR